MSREPSEQPNRQGRQGRQGVSGGAEVPGEPVERDDPAAEGAVDEPAGDAVGAGPPTGEPRVDTALERLTELASLRSVEHVPVFEDVHERLRQVLDELDEG